jgi:hypothetical protein
MLVSFMTWIRSYPHFLCGLGKWASLVRFGMVVYALTQEYYVSFRPHEMLHLVRLQESYSFALFLEKINTTFIPN